MQDEINEKVIALSIRTTKLTAEMLQKSIRFMLSQIKKQLDKPVQHHGIPTKNGNNLVCVLPDTLTSPQLTAEWENALTQIAKGAADPEDFMRGIEEMARELVKAYPFLSENQKDLFKEEQTVIGKCPRCGGNVCEGRKNYYCEKKGCAFVMWKNDRFFEERKTAFTPKIAAALLAGGRAKVKKLYSPKTGKTYDGSIVLADTGGKYVNYRIELARDKELTQQA